MGRTYAVSDLHGRKDLLEAILNYIQPEDHIIFLGDAADRASAGWGMIKAIAKNPQFTYLKGNHEDMLYHALLEYFDPMGEGDYWYSICVQNGGYQTFNDAIEDPAVQTWMNFLFKLPIEYTYINQNGVPIHLTHSGDITGNRKDKIWDREHFNYPYPLNDGGFVVHGHTPSRFVYEEIFGESDEETYNRTGVLFYCPDEMNSFCKVCIDVGAVWKGYTCLLDLDTFEVIKLDPLPGHGMELSQ